METLIRKYIGFHIKIEVFVAAASPDIPRTEVGIHVCQEKQQDVTSNRRFGENRSTRTASNLGHLSPLSTLSLLLSRYTQELHPSYSLQ